MATSWAEEGALADMKYRLDRLRVHQSKQKSLDEEEEPEKVDTLKLLQSKFGSMVYDPTSPMQRAYERRCARTGRRKSIEFEDLYLSKGSGLLQHHALPNPSRPSTPSSSTSTSTPQRPNRSLLGASGPAGPRTRKSSDPAQYYRRQGLPLPPLSDLGPRTGRQGQGQEGHGHGHPRGPAAAAATLSEEDRKLVDQRLSKISSSSTSGLEDGSRDSSSASMPPPLATAQQRRRKISSPSKFPTGKH